MLDYPFPVVNAIVAIAAFSVSFAVLRLLLRSPLGARLVAVPTDERWHEQPTPTFGGVGIFAGLVAGVLVALATGIIEWSGELGGILAGVTIVFVAGLVDDVRHLSPLAKLAAQVTAAVVVLASGLNVEIVGNDLLAWAIGLLWLVGITNAFNLLDNMDGLAAGTAAVASGAFFFIAIMNDQQNGALFAIGLAGAMVGFLRSNFHPATIYMGDAGSLFIGFLMAYLGLKMRTSVTEIPQLFAPVVVLGVAVLDTTIVVVSRARRGVSPFTGGQDHLSHRLRRLGLSVRRAVTTLLIGSVALGVLAVGLSEAAAGVGYWILGASLVSGVMATVVLTTKIARVEAVETSNVTPIRREVG